MDVELSVEVALIVSMPTTIRCSVVREDGDLIQRQTMHLIAFIFNQPLNWVDVWVVVVQMLVET
ncbi:hypothetical protein D3C75_1133750 [compost metagenome]